MSKWHVVITDTETNKVEVDTDTSCIIGALDAQDKGIQVVGFSDCNIKTLIDTALGATKVTKQMTNRDSKTSLAFVLGLLSMQAEEKKEKEEEQGETDRQTEGVEIPFPGLGKHCES